MIWLPRGDDPSRIRGARDKPAVVLAAPVIEDGAVRLTWRAKPGADGYEVGLLTQGFEAFTPPAVVAETTLVIRMEGPFATLPAGTVVLWRVTALRGGAPQGEPATSMFNVP